METEIPVTPALARLVANSEILKRQNAQLKEQLSYDELQRKFDRLMRSMQMIEEIVQRVFNQSNAVRRNLMQTVERCDIDALENLSIRARNTIKNVGCKTIAELISLREADLNRIPNCGKVTIKEIKRSLARLGLQLKA